MNSLAMGAREVNANDRFALFALKQLEICMFFITKKLESFYHEFE